MLQGLFVILRCLSRFILIRNSGKDDYLIIGAMVSPLSCSGIFQRADRGVASQILIIGYVIDIFILKRHHVGYPMTFLTPDDMVSMIKVRAPRSGFSSPDTLTCRKTTLAIQLMYYSIVCFIKTSILFTYLRFGT